MISTYSIKKDLSITNAKWLLNTISGNNPENYLFAFIGKSTPWFVDSEPSMPVDNENDYINDWKNMISLKRIPSSETILAIRKIDQDPVQDIINAYKETCPVIDYKMIMRNPENAYGTACKASGTVLQVVETKSYMQEFLLELEDGNLVYVTYSCQYLNGY